MYCSDCFFFHEDGKCRNPKVTKREVGYFQKAKDCFVLPGTFDKETKTKEKLMETKVCKSCGRELPLAEFKNGKRETTICKDCINAKRKAGIAKHHAKLAALKETPSEVKPAKPANSASGKPEQDHFREPAKMLPPFGSYEDAFKQACKIMFDAGRQEGYRAAIKEMLAHLDGMREYDNQF